MQNTVSLEGFGSGGASLNFKVVGGLTQPADPKENTIWVNTSQKITSWIFAAEAPAEPEEGIVWVTTGASNQVAFNALKKNTVMIYPISAKQYVSGEWQNKTAKTRKNGVWVDWITWIYKDGAFDSSFGRTEKKTPSTANITYNGNNISLSTVGGKVSEVYIVVGLMDLTAISKLILEGTFVKRTHSTFTNVATIFVSESADAGYKNAAAITSLVTKEELEGGYQYTIELDTSALIGNYYVYAGVNTQGDNWENQRQNTITSLRGEV